MCIYIYIYVFFVFALCCQSCAAQLKTKPSHTKAQLTEKREIEEIRCIRLYVYVYIYIYMYLHHFLCTYYIYIYKGISLIGDLAAESTRPVGKSWKILSAFTKTRLAEKTHVVFQQKKRLRPPVQP